MASEDNQDGKKRSKLPLLLGVVLFIVGFGGSFVGVSQGLVPSPKSLFMATEGAEKEPIVWEAPAFVTMEPMVIQLGPEARAQYLRATFVLDVSPGREDDVISAMPRIIDVLNGYLRAVDERDLALPALTMRLRAQMLQQVRLVAPEDSVRAVLIDELLLS